MTTVWYRHFGSAFHFINVWIHLKCNPIEKRTPAKISVEKKSFGFFLFFLSRLANTVSGCNFLKIQVGSSRNMMSEEAYNSFIFFWRGFSESTTIDKITNLKTCSTVETWRLQVNLVFLGGSILWVYSHSANCFCHWCRDNAQLQILYYLGV